MADTNPTGPTAKSSAVQQYLIPLSLLVGALIIGGAVIFVGYVFLNHGNTSGTTSGTPAAATVNIANVKTANEPYIGSANAPVTMALFFDYQCPFCKQFDQTVLSADLYAQYVQTGKLKIVFKDFDFIGPDSLIASEYGRALWQLYPSDFYLWYTGMYSAQVTENSLSAADYTASVEKVLSAIPGVDVSKVTALVASDKTQYDATVTADFTEGQSYGIQGTPSVIVGTTLLQGAQQPAAVTALIDAQLKK
jgi:protein-disulfide isomerase